MSNITLTNGSNEREGLSAKEFNQRLGELAKRWRGHYVADLELRFETGTFLNDHFGLPGKRQTRDQEVLKKAGEQLEISESDISRMRAFAACFKSLRDLKKQYPEAKTWTAVKALLSTLTSKGRAKKAPSNGGTSIATNATQTSSAQLGRLSRSFDTLQSVLQQVPGDLDEERRKELVAKFQEVVEALEKCLKIKVSVSQVATEETPVAKLAA
jgi:uncharacterized tellurite resistance protein B-like protein